MSNNSNWNQGRNDANNNKGAANTNGWSSQAKESYNAGYATNKQGSQSNKGK